MSNEELTKYLDNLRTRAKEFGLERDLMAQRGLDLLRAKEVGMLEEDEEEDDS